MNASHAASPPTKFPRLTRALPLPSFYFSRQIFSIVRYFTVLDVRKVVGPAAKRLGVQYGDGSARWSDWTRWKMGRWKRPGIRLPLLYGERFILHFRLVENDENGETRLIHVMKRYFIRIAGVSSVSSSSSSSASSTGSSNLGKPTRVRQPSGATLRRSQTQSMKMRIQVR